MFFVMNTSFTKFFLPFVVPNNMAHASFGFSNLQELGEFFFGYLK